MTKSNEERNLELDLLRVIPRQIPVEKNKRSDRLTDLIAILFIFGIAMFIRFYVRGVFIGAYGDNVFNLRIKEGDPLGIGSYLGYEPGQTINSEGYSDFASYYIPYVNAFLKGWNPYSGSIVEGDKIGGYVYGPFYIYLISVGAAWFNLTPYYSIVWSNVIFDSLSYVMVYFIAKRVTGNVIAMFVATLGSFSPIALFYANIRVLNAPQMTFFMLISLYYFLEHKDDRGMFFLALATMVKQFPLFMALPVGMWMWRRYGFSKGTSFIIEYILFILLLSIPYIAMTPHLYVVRLFLPGHGKSALNCPAGGEATNLIHSFLVGACDGRTGITLKSDEAPNIANILFPIVNSHILFFGMIFILSWMGFTAYDYMENNPKLYLRFYAAFFMIVHATIARGIYKYYLTFVIPFMILALTPGSIKRSLHIRLGATIHRGFDEWLEPKYRVRTPDIKYWPAIIYLILLTIGSFWLVDSSLSLFISTSTNKWLWRVFVYPIVLFSIIRPSPSDKSIKTSIQNMKDLKNKYISNKDNEIKNSNAGNTDNRTEKADNKSGNTDNKSGKIDNSTENTDNKSGNIEMKDSKTDVDNLVEPEILDLKQYLYRVLLVTPIIIIADIYLLKIAKLYFGDDTTSLNRNNIYMIIIMLLFLMYPVVKWISFGEKESFSTITVNPEQLIMDIILLALGVMVINLFNIQIIIAYRYYTTAVLLTFSFLFLGILGGNFWTSGFTVPKAAFKRYKELKMLYLPVNS